MPLCRRGCTIQRKMFKLETMVKLTKILEDENLRRKLMVRCIIAAQAREGITTTVEQAQAAYDKVRREKK